MSNSLQFNWDTIQYKEDGKVFLLWRHDRIFQENLIKKNNIVLDIGPWGHLDKRIEQEGAKCYLLDNLSPDCYYKERITKHPNFLQGDICNKSDDFLIVYLNTFDVVTCFETLEHVESQDIAISNIYKMLKDNGTFIGTVPIPGFSHAANEPGIKFLNEDELRTLLIKYNFQNIFIEPTGSLNKTDVPCSLYFRCRK